MSRSGRVRWALALVAGGLAIGAAMGVAQEGQGARPAPAGTLSVDFKGGPLKDYVVSLRSAAKDLPVNIVVSGETDAPVPPVTLKGVSVQAAVVLLEHLEIPHYDVSVSAAPDGGAAPVFVVRTRVVQPFARHDGGAPDLAVFSLRSLLQTAPGTPDLPVTRTDASSLLTAVETALTMGGAGEKAEMKFHPETGVLVVRGTVEQTAAVQRLLGEVNGDLQRFRSGATDARVREAQLQAEVRRSQVDMGAAEAEVEFAMKELEQAERLVADGHTSATDLSRAALNVEQKKAGVQRARIQFETAAQMWEAWRSSLKPQEGGPMNADTLREEIRRTEKMLDAMRAELKKIEGATR